MSKSFYYGLAAGNVAGMFVYNKWTSIEGKGWIVGGVLMLSN